MADISSLPPEKGGFDSSNSHSWYDRIREKAKHAARSGEEGIVSQFFETLKTAPNDIFYVRDFSSPDISSGRNLLHNLFADLCEPNDVGKTSLKAKNKATTDIALAYIKGGCAPHARSDMALTPSQYAVQTGLYKVALRMDKQTPTPAQMLDERHRTLLHMLLYETDKNSYVIAAAVNREDDHVRDIIRPDKNFTALMDRLIENSEMMHHRDVSNYTPFIYWVKKWMIDDTVRSAAFNMKGAVRDDEGQDIARDFLETQCAKMIEKGGLGGLTPDEQLNIVEHLLTQKFYSSAAEVISKLELAKTVSTETLKEWLEIAISYTPTGNEKAQLSFVRTLTGELKERGEKTLSPKLLENALRCKAQHLAITLFGVMNINDPALLKLAMHHDAADLAKHLIDQGALDNEGNQHAFIGLLPKIHDARDMVDELMNRLIRPAILLEAGFVAGEEKDSREYHDRYDRLDLDGLVARDGPLYPRMMQHITHRLEPLSEPSNAKDAIRLVDNLSRSWHHPSVVFPNDLIDFKLVGEQRLVREWYPVYRNNDTNHTFTAGNGYTIQCLTNSNQLVEEHNALGHCIDTYTDNCCASNSRMRSHIFSIKDKKGEHVATMEMRYGRHDAIMQLSIDSCDDIISITQIEGKKERGKRQFIRSGPAFDAIKEFAERIEGRFIPRGSSKPDYPLPLKAIYDTGETPESISKLNCPKDIVRIGYVPTWEHLEKAFEEFKSSNRRGAISVSKTNQLVYSDAPGAEPDRLGDQHLIDGRYELDGKELSARDMDISTWLDATGIKSAILEHIRQKAPELLEKAEDKVVELQAERRLPQAEEGNEPTNQIGEQREPGGFLSLFRRAR